MLRIALAFLLWMASFNVASQIPVTRIAPRNIDIENGLLQNTVISIIQDSFGFIWISSNNAIEKYDGYRFVQVSAHADDSTRLLSDKQAYFFLDKKGHVWISHNRGLSVYLHESGIFKNVVRYDKPLSTNETDGLKLAGFDPDGNIWFMKGHDGFYLIDQISFKTTYTGHTIGTQVVPFKNIESTVYQPDGTLIVIGKNELMHMNTEQEKILGTYHLDQHISKAFVINHDAILLNEIDLSLFNISNHSIKKLSGVETKAISYLAEFDSNKMIISGYDNLFLVDRLTGLVSDRIVNQNNKPIIERGHINCLYKDKLGNIWVGTSMNGLFIIPNKKGFLQHWSVATSELNFVRSLYYDDREKKLWSGSFERGIVIYDSLGNTLKQLPTEKLTHNKGNRIGINAFSVWDDQYLLLLSEYSYPQLLDRKNLTVSREVPFLIPDSLKKVYQPNNQRHYFDRIVKHNNHYWISFRGSIMHFEKVNDKLIFKSALPLGRNILEGLQLESDSVLWVGSYNDVYRHILKTNKTYSFSIDENVVIKCILPISSDQIYIGTDNGLFLINRSGAILHSFTKLEGLPDNYIYGLLKDRQNRIWGSTNHGLFVLDHQLGTIHRLLHDPGLQAKEFNTNAYTQAQNGKMFFGGIGGINTFDPSTFSEINAHDSVTITSVIVNDSVLLSEQHYEKPKNITLPYGMADVEIYFSAMNFRKENEYWYRLKDRSTSWSYLGNENKLRISLPNGKNIIELKSGHESSDTITRLSIEILDPWYASTKAWVIYFLFIITALALTYWILTKRRELKHREELNAMLRIQSERERISRDLHDHAGSLVTYMLMNIEKAGLQNSNEIIQELQTTGRSLMDTLRETIWAINEREITNEDFADKLKTYCQKYIRIPVIYSENFDSVKMLPKEKVLQLFRICHEALNNATKHSQCTQVSVAMKSTSTMCMDVTISDNGIGFDMNTSKKESYGLRNIITRAQQAGLKLSIQSQTGEGTKIQVSIP